MCYSTGTSGLTTLSVCSRLLLATNCRLISNCSLTVLYDAFYSCLCRHYWNGILGPSIMNPNRKRIQCPYCEETYRHEQNFKDHVSLKHTGVKSHICKICGASFGHQNQLVRHKQTQHKNQK